MASSHPFLYAMDPATTLYTFFLKTDPSIRSVRLIGSWDNFAMSYAMERDSRREGGQWRGCHTFKDIICDGDASSAAASASAPQKRSGGLKQGSTYYYYYEVDADTETHNPVLPSTTTCPYLPGQRVNTLHVPSEKSSRQRSASVSSAHRADFKTMNPADKFVTPRPPPATPAITPAAGPALRSVSSLSALRRPLSPRPSPRKLLHHQRSACSLAPAPSAAAAPSVTAPSISAPSFSTWSPRRFFTRRSSPSRAVTNAADLDTNAHVAADGERGHAGHASIDHDDHASVRHAPPMRLPSSSSSVSTGSRLRHATIFPASPGSRSRDISPESLRRFLVDDDVVRPAVATLAAQHNATVTTETETDDDDCDFATDYDDANFAASAVSENAPFTILSPPPPSRNATPVNPAAQLRLQQQQQQQQQDRTPILTLRTSIPPPVRPARACPAAPEMSSIQRNLAQMNLGLEMPSSMSRASSASISSMTSLSPMSQSDADADDDEECYGTAGAPAALFLPPPPHPFGSDNTGHSKSEAQQQKHYRHHLFDAALTGSTATLVPGNGLVTAPDGNGLNELVDELGWMATAIRG